MKKDSTKLLFCNPLRKLVPVGLAVFLVGCGHHYRVNSIINTNNPKPTSWKKRDYAHILSDGVSWREVINPYTYGPDPKQPPFYQIALTSTNARTAQTARNNLQQAIIRVSKEETAKHLSRLKATENSVNLILGSAQLALSGGASVAAESSAKLLAAASTGAGGGRALFNEQVYKNTLLESLTSAVLVDQESFYESVIRPRQRLTINQYGVEEAINDAIEYHKRGSFYYGLSLLREAIENKTSTNRARVELLQQTNISRTISPDSP